MTMCVCVCVSVCDNERLCAKKLKIVLYIRRKRSCIAKRTILVKKIMYGIIFTTQGPVIQAAVRKGRKYEVLQD